VRVRESREGIHRKREERTEYIERKSELRNRKREKEEECERET